MGESGFDMWGEPGINLGQILAVTCNGITLISIKLW